MEIGKPQRIRHIDPAVIPVPERKPVPRRFDPVKPRKPVQDPSRKPVKVPAR